jgi:hypothetical protein
LLSFQEQAVSEPFLVLSQLATARSRSSRSCAFGGALGIALVAVTFTALTMGGLAVVIAEVGWLGTMLRMLIKGTWLHEEAFGSGTPLEERGSYVRQAGGEMHVDRCISQEPCVLFLFQSSRANVILPE